MYLPYSRRCIIAAKLQSKNGFSKKNTGFLAFTHGFNKNARLQVSTKIVKQHFLVKKAYIIYKTK